MEQQNKITTSNSNKGNSIVTKIVAHAYDWKIQDSSKTENERDHILAWCLDKNSKPYLLRFPNFPVFCYVELPKKINGRPYTWTNYNKSIFVGWMKKRLGEQYEILNWRAERKPKLYYYQANNKSELVLLMFKNIKTMKRCAKILAQPINYLDKKNVRFTILENKISMHRKMLTIRQCGYAQWFSVNGILVPEDERISTCKREYMVPEWNNLKPIGREESQGWTTHPGCVVFDGEMYSKNHNSFPDMTNSEHPCYMLSCVYQRIGLRDTRERYLIIMGDLELPEEYANTNPSKIIKVENEVDLCDAFAELIAKLDPEIISGYNIFGFDYPYLNARLGRKGKDWKHCSRLYNFRPKLDTKIWESSGYGFNEINILDMPGRISIDMLPIIRREHKLSKYDLNTVGKYMLDRGKHDVSPKEMFRIYERITIAKKRLDGCIKAGTIESPIYHEFIDKSLIDKVVTDYDKAKKDMGRVAAYCIEDSELVLDIIEFTNIWIALVELSSIVGIPIMDTFTRGQQIRVLSQMYNLATKRGYVIDSRIAEKENFKGAFVENPIPGVYDYVICLDFKSLYPSIIIAYNICYTTLIPPSLDHLVPDHMCNVFEWDDEFEVEVEESDDLGDDLGEDPEKKTKIKIIHRRYKFIKAEHKKGILPELVSYLIDERNRVKKQMKAATNPTMKVILDMRQKGLKVSANSMYGALGVQKGGMLPLIEGAMCVTGRGRELIRFCTWYCEKVYNGLSVYGDTDSIMIKLPETLVSNNLQSIEWGIKLEHEISALFPKALYLEFEKAGRMCCITKKRYAYWIVNLYDNKKKGLKKGDLVPVSKIMHKGTVKSRRDNCKFQRDLFEKVLMKLLNRRPMQETLDILVKEIDRLLSGKVPWEDLVMIKGLGASYKNEKYCMKVFADELMKIGKPAQPGERLEFLIIDTDKGIKNASGGILLGSKMRLPQTYLERLGTDKEEKIDYLYYLEKLLMKIIEQLWQIGYNLDLCELEGKSHLENHVNILNELVAKGYGNVVEQVMTFYKYNLDHCLIYLLSEHSPIKNRTIEARRKHVSGRSVFDKRLGKKPIKTIVKGFQKGKYEEVIQNFITPKLYKTIRPNAPPKSFILNMGPKISLPEDRDWKTFIPGFDFGETQIRNHLSNQIIKNAELFLTKEAYDKHILKYLESRENAV